MFLCCGDALVDCFATEDGAASIRLDGRIGGSGLNVALGLARLGRKVAFLTKNGTDPIGRRILGFLRNEGIDTRLVIGTDRNSTLAIVETDASGEPRYAFHAEGSADRSLTPAELPPLPPEIRALHVGSYTTVLEPAASAYLALVRREHGQRFVAYDPNVRLTAAPDPEVWRQSVTNFAASAHLLKLSQEDARQLYPKRGIEALAADWIQRGVRLVVVTRARDGAVAFTSEGCSAAMPALPVTVADTLGAGDSFQAALLAWLERHDALLGTAASALDSDALQAMLGFASRAAAVTCSRRGADLPRFAELA